MFGFKRIIEPNIIQYSVNPREKNKNKFGGIE
jgi:hypothetical protein